MARMRFTQSARSAPAAGTTGNSGGPAPAGSRPGKRSYQLGDEVYLWILIAVELALTIHFRAMFSRYHGG